MAKVKEVPDEQFEKILALLPRLVTSQVDKLWEQLRLEVRRRYWNEGIASAARVIEKIIGRTSVLAIHNNVNVLKTAKDAVEAKVWQYREPKKKDKKAP